MLSTNHTMKLATILGLVAAVLMVFTVVTPATAALPAGDVFPNAIANTGFEDWVFAGTNPPRTSPPTSGGGTS